MAVFSLGASARADAVPADSAAGTQDLTQFRLEDLVNVEVTSAAKREQRLPEIAAAITVIGRDRIRASGATTLAEVLRLVPGFQVAQIDANKWSISARGFSGRIANKLLLLVDGRSVYSPIFSGVYWDEQDLELDDIDRIEVIRGPGASVWGVNAVNGVINVITRDAHETQGVVVSAATGTEETGGGSVRWGGTAADGRAYRAFLRGLTRAGGFAAGQPDAWDSWRSLHGGFRMDGPAIGSSRWTVQGEMRGGRAGQNVPMASDVPPYTVLSSSSTHSSGGHLLANWTNTLSPRSDLRVFGYGDMSDRDDQVVRSRVRTLDLELEHHFRNARHEIVWGLDGRLVQDHIDSTAIASIAPARSTYGLASVFGQDELGLFDRRLRITIGAKLEGARRAGLQLQPTARVLWSPGSQHAVWAAVSRAARTPSRAETGIRYLASVADAGGVPAYVRLYGNSDFDSEILTAYEVGYRFIPGATSMFDLTGFYDQYGHLSTLEPVGSTFVPTPSPHVDVSELWSNRMAGDTRGAELSWAWSPSRLWKLDAAASCLAMQLRPSADSGDPTAKNGEKNEPSYQLVLQSQFRPAAAWNVDATTYRIGERPAQQVPAYTRLDLRVAFRPIESSELEVLGKNLLTPRHLEDNGRTSGLIPTEVERSLTLRLSVRF